jgi:hypothetical protein
MPGKKFPLIQTFLSRSVSRISIFTAMPATTMYSPVPVPSSSNSSGVRPVEQIISTEAKINIIIN